MITVYTIAYNEEVFIEFMIDHYRYKFPGCHIVVYDNMSTDRTVELARINGCEVISYDTNNQISDSKYLEIKNNCWKTAKTDWVLVCDMDELLNINYEQLKTEDAKGVTIIKSEAYNMVNMEDNYDLANIKYGSRCNPYDKSYLFKKSVISEINYTHGCHKAKPIGTIKYSDTPYILYHYKCINPDFMVNRYIEYNKRLSDDNKKHGWGNHYSQSPEVVRDTFLTARTYVEKIFQDELVVVNKRGLSFKAERDIGISDTLHFWNAVNSDTWEPETFSVLEKYLSKDHSYLDIGAWVGPTVLFGAQLCKKCYAFEPDPIAFNGLKKNLDHNPNINNVDAYQIAISDHTGLATIGAKIKRGDSMSSLIWDKSSQDSWEIPCITIEDVIIKNNISDCNFIKMDIEGGEAIVLPASINFFKSVKPTLYLSLHTPWFDNKKDFFDRVNEVLSLYNTIYNSNGDKIKLSDLPHLAGFQAVVATNV
jgi:FkbM family methyltransferase